MVPHVRPTGLLRGDSRTVVHSIRVRHRKRRLCSRIGDSMKRVNMYRTVAGRTCGDDGEESDVACNGGIFRPCAADTILLDDHKLISVNRTKSPPHDAWGVGTGTMSPWDTRKSTYTLILS